MGLRDIQTLLINEQTKLFEKLPFHVLILNTKGEIVYANAAWKNYSNPNNFNYDASGIGMDYFDIAAQFIGTSNQKLSNAFKKILDGYSENYEGYYLTPKDKKWFRISISPTEYNAQMAVLIMHTETGPDVFANEIIRKNIMDSEKFKLNKDSFFRKLSYELRTPLNLIIGFADLIIKEVHGPINNVAYLEYIKDIRIGGDTLMDSIDKSLDEFDR